jgi:hypothetical protein
LIRVVARCLAVIAVATACETSVDNLIGFPGGGGGAVTQAQASGDWSLTLRKTTTLACSGGSLADGQILVAHLSVQSDGTVVASSWQTPSNGAVLPASGTVRLSDGFSDLILSSASGGSGMELRGTVTSSATFTGTLTDPAPGLSPIFSTGGCEYTANGTKA